MKALVGVDIAETYQSSLELCKKLQLPDLEWLLASTVPLATYYPAGPYFGLNPGDETRKYMREAAQCTLSDAMHQVGSKKATEFLVDGETTSSLLRLADEHDVDLIVVGSGQSNGGLLWKLGSVSRALTYGSKQSLLVTKQPFTPKYPIHAIFATDHSPYAERAAKQLIEWAPKGFGQIDIVTAYDMDPKAIRHLQDTTEVLINFENWLRDEAHKKSDLLAKEFGKIAPIVKVRVMKGEVNEVLHRAMTMSSANLLILGAQGHGFIERLLIGSVALHQVVAEPYSVLVIRPNLRQKEHSEEL